MVKKALHAFITDKHGKVVLWQAPNLPIIGWFVFMIASLFVGASKFHAALSLLSTAFLFTWAYLEITQGASPFRRTLGLVVLIVAIFGFLRMI